MPKNVIIRAYFATHFETFTKLTDPLNMVGAIFNCACWNCEHLYSNPNPDLKNITKRYDKIRTNYEELGVKWLKSY